MVARRYERGITTAEVTITLVIIALITVIASQAARTFLSAYYRSGAARQLAADIRNAQGLAVARGFVFGLQWGGATGVNMGASNYRIVRDAGSCTLPATSAARDGTSVITSWVDLSKSFPGMKIQSITDSASVALGGVMFNSRGASVNTCTTTTFPVTVTLADRWGRTRQIEIRSAGMVRLL